VKARQEAGGRRQEKNNYGIKTGFSMISQFVNYPLGQSEQVVFWQSSDLNWEKEPEQHLLS
jgi:hypothetical protein